MQSSCLPHAVHEIFKDKLQSIDAKYSQVLETITRFNEHLKKLKEKVNSLINAGNYTATDGFVIATQLDELLYTITTYHAFLKKILTKLEMEHTSPCESNVLEVKTSVTMDSNYTTLNMIQDQMKALQQQLFCLQESHNSRLHELETKTVVLQADKCEPDNNFNIRMQNIEAKILLLEDLRLKEENSKQNVEKALSKVEEDVKSGEYDINRLDIEQDVLGERIREVKIKVDELVKLKNNFNDLHKTLTQTEALSQKFNQMEEDLTILKSLLGPWGQTKEKVQVQQHETLLPAFAVYCGGNERQRVSAGDRICFSNIWQESESYDPTTNSFTAPVGGLYLFSVSINADSEGTLGVYIKCNGEGIACCGASGRKDEQTSVTTFRRLAPGDQVWIEAEEQTSKEGVYVGRGFSSFIGCCLK